jgi:hypothetical protein
MKKVAVANNVSTAARLDTLTTKEVNGSTQAQTHMIVLRARNGSQPRRTKTPEA